MKSTPVSFDPERPDPSSPDSADGAQDGSRSDPAQWFFPDMNTVARALEQTSIGVWSWDVGRNRITWSRNLEGIHRFPSGSFDGSFSAFEEDIHPEDRATVAAAIRDSLKTRQPYSVIYRLPTRVGEGERWLTAAGGVVVDDGNNVVKLFGICRDVTNRVLTERELRLREHRQEIVARLGARALAEEDLQGLLDDISSTVATVLDVELVNILELVSGDSELVFRSSFGWNPDIIGVAQISASARSQAHYALAAFGPVIVSDLRSETRFTPAPVLLAHGVVSGMSTTIIGHDRRKYGIFSVHTKRRRIFTDYDASLLTSVANILAGTIQRSQLDQRQKMMIRELHHRSGNLFSQLLALLSQTAKTSRSKADLVSKYQTRVIALADANRFMVEGGWRPASVLKLLSAQLAPHLDRISLTGPEVHLEPALALALSSVAHELVSNAVKYGSLSVSAGRIDLQWSLDRTQQSVTLLFDWRELNGPKPKRRTRAGFGLRLIDTVIKRQVKGKVRRTFLASGLRCRLSIPLTPERWPERPTGD